ncbi:Tim44 domain-containing protein [Geomonas sp. RF6]|uniref:Tim44 domain-containing protein n=1 Tax=Geomonas sp. RF6 TaxID=2897342 RepID=UPI001E2D40A3|nr:Tim44 domain-containing protein [Geomonas sp. RF6]UFS68995.1 Tim44 domain-containing protein [Geomonas sp. RF6]
MKRVLRGGVFLAAMLFAGVTVFEQHAEARAGGGRSMGSRGSRSYSQPRSSYSYPGQSRPYAAPATRPFQQPQSGGFLRSMAGGIMGGLLGGMLFSSLGFAGGAGGFGGGGIGVIEIILLAGIGYLIFRMVRKKMTPATATAYGGTQRRSPEVINYGYPATSHPSYGAGAAETTDNADSGIDQIRRMDPGFDESRFNDAAMDIFFKIQGAWMRRDLSTVSGLLTDEMRDVLETDVKRLLQERRVNRLEQIAVRKVEIVEAWQEMGQDYLTTLFQANLLDYTTDESTGAIVSGSATEPVRFEEYWTFVRPVGNNPWRLTSIEQK